MPSIFDLPLRRGHVEILHAAPNAASFYPTYASGFGKPVLFRGLARTMPAFEQWHDDDGVGAAHGDAWVEVEYAKKETRVAPRGRLRMRTFLAEYNTSDVYAISPLPQAMQAHVNLPRFLQCGYATAYLDTHNVWWSSGGTRSVLHNDDQDNLYCLFSGEKRIAFFHPWDKARIESDELGWVVADDEPRWGYGAYSGRINIEDLDLQAFPGWAELEWWEANIQPGDCVFIPTAWYHGVSSSGRNVAVNLWWWRRDQYDEGSLRCIEDDGDLQVSLAGCTWGYDGPPGGPVDKVEQRLARGTTSCAGLPPAAGTAGQPPRHAASMITAYQRLSVPAAEKVARRQRQAQERQRDEL